MSAIEIKQESCQCTLLTTWMGFHAGNVSNGNQAEKLQTTHRLDDISCRQCQQWKSSRRAAQLLTPWIKFHAGNVSNGNQAEELQTTHHLVNISCRQCQ